MKTEQLKSFFYFSKSERRGILLLIFFILLSVISPRIAGMLIKNEEELTPELSKEVAAFLNEMADTSSLSNLENREESASFKFSPISNKKSEFSRNESPKRNDNSQINKKLTIQPMNLNKIDSSDLLKVTGIGPSYAHRILKYRERLGGFVRIDQLKEIYGMTIEKYDQIKPQFIIELSDIKKVDLNNASFKDLMRHPYSSYELAKAICRFRTKYGKIDNVDDILKAGVIADTSFRKLQPYLAVN